MYMNIKNIALIALAATFIPSGVVFPASKRPDLKGLQFNALNQEDSDDAEEGTGFISSIKAKAKAFAKWLTFERFVGGAAAMGLIYFIHKQSLSNDTREGGNKGRRDRGGNGPKRLSFRDGYAARLHAPAENDPAPVEIRGPDGRRIIIEQRIVVNQDGPTCPFHSSANADMIAFAELHNNGEHQRNSLRDPAIVGGFVSEYGEHAERVINGQIPFVDAWLREASAEDPSLIDGLKRSTASSGWAESAIPKELLARNVHRIPRSNSAVVYFSDGAPQFNEAELRQPGIHRVAFADNNPDRQMGDFGVHYFSGVINRDVDNNTVRYVIADSLGNRDRRQNRMVNRLIAHLEYVGGSRNEIIDNVNDQIGAAIRDQRAARPAAAAAPRPAAAANGSANANQGVLTNPAPAPGGPGAGGPEIDRKVAANPERKS
jgi:hypothetical protein